MATPPLLAGVKVLELGQYVPAPYAALSLADLGADVIKIEPPAGDPMREVGRVRQGPVSVSYETMNGGKSVLRLDLKTAPARAVARDLVARADVLIESYRPGVLDRLGLDRETLQRINPRLVHCAITGFGQNGPLAQAAGHDLTYMATGGGLGLSGTAAAPVMTRPPVSDFAAGLQAGMTVLAGLLRRETTGRGCYIDIAMSDVVLAWQGPTLSEALGAEGAVARGVDPETGGLACYNLYRVACGTFVTLAAEEDRFWQRFCAAVGRPDLMGRNADPAPQTELIALLGALFSTREAAAWEALLAPADCCFQRVLMPDEVVAFPQFADRAMISRRGAVVDVNRPSWIDGAPPAPRRGFVEYAMADAAALWR
ncbi:CaiB/BaiF CoA transferase family protein [Ensifer soli]|uniref:CaiB/BaiF CoA transferase family protein n=1 Tax=Ciceribacter sp. sgz301302 TaxID=3342379 RepID=UPI0035BB3D34